MKKYLLLFTFFLMSICIFGIQLKIYTEDSPPLNFINENGEIDGFSTEIVKAIQKKLGDTYTIEVLPWNRAYLLATQKGEGNIILYSTTFSEERRDLFHWVGPIFDNSWTFYALRDKNIEINSLEDAKKVNKVGTYTSDVREEFLKKEGFTNIASFRNTKNNIFALKSGRTDLWLSSTLGFQHIAKEENIDPKLFKAVYKIKTVGLFITFSKSTSKEIVDQWQNAYDSLKQEGIIEEICKKWGIDVPEYKIPSLETKSEN